ncbi:MAG: RlmE family RNA methyltransferase [Spirochaetales bacterium]|nr:RlmE family RNA methyltransferase [Spirochaetales bacterium]
MNRSKPDHYTIRAIKEGYPARSVYKLEEIDQKFKVIKKGAKILDIGAAPGSWSLYSLKKTGNEGFVLGIDFKDIKLKQFPNFKFIQDDAFSESTLEEINKIGEFDLVLSDAAPATTGNRTVDTARSEELVEQVIDLAAKIIAGQGYLIVKIFQGQNAKKMIDLAKEKFEIVKTFKPQACRKDSFETYIIANKKKQ